MIAILGRSGSGKTALINELNKTEIGLHKIVSCSTRPIRDGERGGVDYNFIEKTPFLMLADAGFFATTTCYNGWWYGLPKTLVGQDNTVAIVTPSELRKLKKEYDVCSVLLDVDRRTCLKKQIERGDDIEEAYRRNVSDVGQFDGVENEVDIVVDNKGLRKTVSQIINELIDKGVIHTIVKELGDNCG